MSLLTGQSDYSFSVDAAPQRPAAPPRPDDPKAPKPPGGMGLGTSWLGGPATTDAFGARRAPSPWQLIEKYKSLIYSMVSRNRNAVCRLPLRLYADGSRVQGGKPRSACDPIRVTRSVGMRLARSGNVSPAAVDQVYEVRNHPILQTLDRPDPYGYMTRDKLIGLITAYNDVIGGAYVVPEGNGWREGNAARRGPPDYLWVLYSQYVVPIRFAASVLIDKWQYFGERIPFNDVLWFRHTHSLRDPYGAGYSPTYAGDVYASQEDRFSTLFDQVLGMPRPALIATAKDPSLPPGEVESKRFEQDMQRKQSQGYAGGILVNRGSWEFTTPDYAEADLASKEISEYDLYRLAAIFDQPATYYTVDSNLANLQAADEQHARVGIEPRCKATAGTLTHLVQSWDPRLFFEFDPAIAEDEISHATVVQMMLQTGQATINQVNEDGKWPPVPWGDEPWLPGTLKQPTMLQEAHDQEQEASKAQIDQGEQGLGVEAMKVKGAKPESKDEPAKKAERSIDEDVEALAVRVLESIDRAMRDH